MRILHTSDWHLGASTGPASRLREQETFLDWLLETLRAREVDALLLAGDVFDSMHPSAEAQTLYFRFLARLAGTGVRDVVIVGGNHDSPSRLDAPRSLLQAVNVHVVGGVPSAEHRLDRMVVPLRERGSDEVAAVCLAVPYVHEYRLGIRTSDLDQGGTRAAFAEAFRALYSDLVDRARERFPDRPCVATGHLTLGEGSTSEDYPQPIHQVGTIEGLPPTLLDPRICYAALGHIHRCYPVKDSVAWYSGSPIPYSLREMKPSRRVLLVELGDEVQVERVDVPRSRDLVELTGTPDSVIAALENLTWATPLPPLVHARVETEAVEPGLARRLHEAVAAHGKSEGPVLVEVQQRAAAVETEGPAAGTPSLEELSPPEVFALLCDAAGLTGDSRRLLEVAFETVASITPDALELMLDDIALPPTGGGDAP